LYSTLGHRHRDGWAENMAKLLYIDFQITTDNWRRNEAV
jgi:hypothetical protein